MSAYLLDTNVLIALAWPQHIHHATAHDWFARVGNRAWATCPLTQLAFLRISSNSKIIPEAVTPRAGLEMLRRIIAVPGHEFWADDVPPTEAAVFESVALVGHRQITDAYLLALAQRRKGKLATLDGGIAELIPARNERARRIAVVG